MNRGRLVRNEACVASGTGSGSGSGGRRAAWLGLFALLPALLGGCGGDPSRQGYDQTTPEGVIQTARLMVQGGHAERLGELMYADSPEWRELYLRLGELLGEVQDLAGAVREHMPEEVEEVRAEATAAAREGRASNYLQQVLTGRRGARPASPGGRGGANPERMLNDTLKQIASDPYGWVEESEERLGIFWVDDDTPALTWDDRSILPPIGITMKQGEDGLWYLVLPTSLPQLRPVMPDTPEEFNIWAQIVQVMENAVRDMRTAVETRRVDNLDDLSREAGRNLMIPMVMCFAAYGQLVEADMRAQREAARAERQAREAEQAPSPSGENPAPPPGPDAPIQELRDAPGAPEPGAEPAEAPAGPG